MQPPYCTKRFVVDGKELSYGDCGSSFAPVYFLAFIVCCNFTMINLFVGTSPLGLVSLVRFLNPQPQTLRISRARALVLCSFHAVLTALHRHDHQQLLLLLKQGRQRRRHACTRRASLGQPPLSLTACRLSIF